MKKTALLAAVAAIFVATPAMAQSGGGHIGLNYGNTDLGGDDDVETWQVDTAIGGSNGSFGYQFDGGLGSSDFDGEEGDHYTLAGHLFFAGGENWRIGGVYAYTHLEDAVDEIGETAYGIEGSFNLGANLVLTGSYTQGETEFFVDVDTSNFDVGADFYLTDNFRVGGNVGTGSLEFDGGDDIDTTTLGVDAEWRPWSAPISFRASYESFDVDDLFDGSVDTLKVGVRFNFGETLRATGSYTPFDTRTGLFQRVYGIN